MSEKRIQSEPSNPITLNVGYAGEITFLASDNSMCIRMLNEKLGQSIDIYRDDVPDVVGMILNARRASNEYEWLREACSEEEMEELDEAALLEALASGDNSQYSLNFDYTAPDSWVHLEDREDPDDIHFDPKDSLKIASTLLNLLLKGENVAVESVK